MPASPIDIAKFTVDGTLVSVSDPDVKEAVPSAFDLGTTEIESFFDDPTDTLALLAERFSLIGALGRPHEAVELERFTDIGRTIPDDGASPQYRVIDEERSIDAMTITLALAFDMTTDRYSLELVGKA